MCRLRFLDISYSDNSSLLVLFFCFFFFTDPPPTEIYTLSLHDALPISSHLFLGGVGLHRQQAPFHHVGDLAGRGRKIADMIDRKSTRLNSSHTVISYAVFCLKKKKKRIEE